MGASAVERCRSAVYAYMSSRLRGKRPRHRRLGIGRAAREYIFSPITLFVSSVLPISRAVSASRQFQQFTALKMSAYAKPHRDEPGNFPRQREASLSFLFHLSGLHSTPPWHISGRRPPQPFCGPPPPHCGQHGQCVRRCADRSAGRLAPGPPPRPACATASRACCCWAPSASGQCPPSLLLAPSPPPPLTAPLPAHHSLRPAAHQCHPPLQSHRRR